MMSCAVRSSLLTLKCRAPVPPSSARLYMALLTDDRHPRSNQRTVAVIQSPLQPGLMRLISRNLVWCVFPQRTPSLLVRTPVSLRLTQPLSRLRSSSIDHPKCPAPVPPSSARLYMALLTDNRHPRSNQRTMAVIQSSL